MQITHKWRRAQSLNFLSNVVINGSISNHGIGEVIRKFLSLWNPYQNASVCQDPKRDTFQENEQLTGSFMSDHASRDAIGDATPHPPNKTSAFAFQRRMLCRCFWRQVLHTVRICERICWARKLGLLCFKKSSRTKNAQGIQKYSFHEAPIQGQQIYQGWGE